jgi:hypothetical protein
MKTARLLSVLLVCFGLTVVMPSFSSETVSCYAQVKLTQDKNKIEWWIAEIKDPLNAQRAQDVRDFAEKFSEGENITKSPYRELVVNTYIDLLFNDPNIKVRENAATGLGFLGDNKAAPALKKALDDKDTEIRIEAAGALVRLGFGKDEKVFSTLEYFVRGKDVEKWNIRITYLTTQTTEEREKDKNNSILGLRQQAMWYIADINIPKTKSLLEDMTKDPGENVRKWAEKLLKDKFIKK